MTAVAYEELEGSPKITIDRKGGHAERVFKIAWVDVPAFFTVIFPNPLNGYTAVAWVPGYSHLLAESAKAEPFDPTKPGGTNVGSDLTYSDTAKVTVNYAPPQQDQQQQSKEGGGGGDGKGPGGDKGVTGGEKGTAAQPVTLVTHELHIGAEFLTISNLILVWDDGTDAGPQVRAGKLIPTQEHQTTWHNVDAPPWGNISDCAGGLNNGTFLGAATGCALYLGAEASRDITNEGAKAWTLKYKYSVKDYDGKGKGWNYFYRAEKGAALKLDMLKTKADGLPIYEYRDFKSLFNETIIPFAPPPP